MIAKDWAIKNLSEIAISQAIHQGKWIFFEEDQDYAIACYESEEIGAAMGVNRDEVIGVIDAIVPYAIAKGIKPDRQALDHWKRLYYHPSYHHNVDLTAIAEKLTILFPDDDPRAYHEPSLAGKEYSSNAHYTGSVTLDDGYKLWAEVVEEWPSGSEWPFQVSL